MARVEIATQSWGWIVDSAGNGLANQTITLKNLDGTAATHWSAVTGGSSSTAALTSNADGTLPRYIEGGTYELYVSGALEGRVDAVPGSIQAGRTVNIQDFADLVVSGVWDAALDAAVAVLAGARGIVYFRSMGATSYIFDAAHTLAAGQFLMGEAPYAGSPATNFTCRFNGVQWKFDSGNGGGFINIVFTGDTTKAGQDPLVDLGHATNPTTCTLKDCRVQSAGGDGIRVRNVVKGDFRGTSAYGNEGSGWIISGFANDCQFGGAEAMNNKEWGVDYWGGNGNDLGLFRVENNSLHASTPFGGTRVRGGTDQNSTIAFRWTPRFENNDGPLGTGVPLQIDAEGPTYKTVVVENAAVYSGELACVISGGIFKSTAVWTDRATHATVGSSCRGAKWELPTYTSGTFAVTDASNKARIETATDIYNFLRMFRAGTSDQGFCLRVTGEAVDRLQFLMSGAMLWSDGTAAADTRLERGSADLLQTPDGLRFTATDGKGRILMAEQSAQPAALANAVNIFAEDNGSGKTRLMARFGSGVAQQMAIEP